MDFPAIFKYRLLLLLTQLYLTMANALDTCHLQVFKAECTEGQVIMMTSAQYGLMDRMSNCVQKDTSNVVCSADVLSLSDSKCSGKNKCEITIPNSDFESKAPKSCSYMKLYYKASYTCVKVQFVKKRKCQRCDYIPVSDNNGLIASSVTQETNCGSEQCPWLIEVNEGQKVKVSLFDYVTTNRARSTITGSCDVYMVIQDGDRSTHFSICRDRARGKTELYTSTTNRVYVKIHVPSGNAAAQSSGNNFVVKYEATGCQLLQKPDYGWVRYDNDYAYLACNATGKESTLICKNTTWKGHFMNCSMPAPGEAENDRPSSLKNVLIVVIIAGVAVCMCSCVVVIGLCCFKGMSNKRRHERFPPPPPYDVSYEKHTGEATESHVMLTQKEDPDILQKLCDIHGTIRHVDHVKTKQGYRKEEGKDHTLNRGHQTLKPAKHHYEQIWEKQHAKTAHMKNTL